MVRKEFDSTESPHQGDEGRIFLVAPVERLFILGRLRDASCDCRTVDVVPIPL